MALDVAIFSFEPKHSLVGYTTCCTNNNDVLFSNGTECAHILEDIQSASCDAATRLSGLIFLKDS
jgi:hypothetical protein